MTRTRPRVALIVESGTDVRLVEGLAPWCELTIAARRIEGGVEISRPPGVTVETIVGPASFAQFARFVFSFVRARRGRVDFVLAQGYGAAALGANLAARIISIPAAMLVCSPVEEYYRCRRTQSGFGKPYRLAERVALTAAARLNHWIGGRYIVLSEYLASVVRSHGAPRDVQVIPVYGVDTSVFRPADVSARDLRTRRGLPDTGALIFSSSRVAPEKDSTTLLRAFRRLREQHRDVYLLHRSGGFRRFLTEAAAEGVADRVIATDAVHPHGELPLDYCSSDVCVQSSHAEGLGYSVLEAMACGVPVVASSVGGLRETVIDGVTGWTCPPRSPDALAERLGHVLDHAAEARRLAVAARAMVQERYERTAVFGRLEQAVREAVALAP